MTVDSIAAAPKPGAAYAASAVFPRKATPIRWLWRQRLSASYKALAEGHIKHVTDAALSFGFTIFLISAGHSRRPLAIPPHAGAPLIRFDRRESEAVDDEDALMRFGAKRRQNRRSDLSVNPYGCTHGVAPARVEMD